MRRYVNTRKPVLFKSNLTLVDPRELSSMELVEITQLLRKVESAIFIENIEGSTYEREKNNRTNKIASTFRIPWWVKH